jgi:hypothetical protein
MCVRVVSIENVLSSLHYDKLITKRRNITMCLAILMASEGCLSWVKWIRRRVKMLVLPSSFVFFKKKIDKQYLGLCLCVRLICLKWKYYAIAEISWPAEQTRCWWFKTNHILLLPFHMRNKSNEMHVGNHNYFIRNFIRNWARLESNVLPRQREWCGPCDRNPTGRIGQLLPTFYV